MKNKWKFRFALIPLGILLLGFVVFSLWNWLVPALFQGPMITYWQAFGLLLLSKILFGGHGGWGHGRCGCHSGKNWNWRARMEEKMAGMTPEEREKFKKTFKERCGRFNWNEPTEPEAGAETK